QLKTVIRFMISAKARNLAERQEYRTLYPDILECRFTQKWMNRFMSHYRLVNHQRTTTAQKLSEEYNELQQNFLAYILYRHERTSFTITLVCLADRSNLYSLLVLDTFTAHRTDPVKCHFCERNTDIAVIPSVLTSRLQPLDVSLNKAFKAR
ncbi:601_t:CDS:2, partial [Scutellospora calospora]